MKLNPKQIRYLKEVKQELGRQPDPTNFEADLYRFLSKLFEDKVDADEVKVVFDDSLYLIEFEDKEFKFKPTTYTDTVSAILSKEQLYRYFEEEREFYISREILNKHF